MEEIFFGLHLGSVIHWEKALGTCSVLLLFPVHPLPVICTGVLWVWCDIKRFQYFSQTFMAYG